MESKSEILELYLGFDVCCPLNINSSQLPGHENKHQKCSVGSLFFVLGRNFRHFGGKAFNGGLVEGYTATFTQPQSVIDPPKVNVTGITWEVCSIVWDIIYVSTFSVATN